MASKPSARCRPKVSITPSSTRSSKTKSGEHFWRGLRQTIADAVVCPSPADACPHRRSRQSASFDRLQAIWSWGARSRPRL